MKTFDLPSIEIKAPFARSFDYIANPGNLPEWTEAFKEIRAGKAEMRTENGSVLIDLLVTAPREFGIVDWTMTFPDRNVATACSRLVENGPETCVYSFVLKAPAMPLEQLEGALTEQARKFPGLLATIRSLQAAQRAVALYRSQPELRPQRQSPQR